MTDSAADRLRLENTELRRRLEDAEETLQALRAGEVDAVVVGSGQEQVYTLDTVDKPYRLLVEKMSHGAATLTAEGAIIHCNQRFCDLLGRPQQALAGKPLQDFVAADSASLFRELLQNGRTDESRCQIVLARTDGELLTAYLCVATIQAGALGSCLVVSDLTEQWRYQELKRTQDALRLSEERLDLAQRAGRIGTFEWNPGAGTVNWSPAMEELYGLPAGAFGGRYADWLQAIHPEDRERVQADSHRAIASHSELDIEFRIAGPDGQTRWIHCKGKPLGPEDGESLRMIGVNLDITSQKRIEQELRQADSRKDEFLATLAHELRNPLAPIRNAMYILKAQNTGGGESNWPLGVLERQIGTMARLLEDLLDVSRISRNTLDLRRERCMLSAVLDAALETSRPTMDAASHKLAVMLPPNPVYLDADPIRLAQLFANLLNNAAKYTEPGGHIWLSAGQHDKEVVVSVRDDGIGIPPELIPRIFDIFSQAKTAVSRSQGGLGIGLSLVKGIAELHGGRVEAHSAGADKGTEFTVYLPIVE